MLRGAWTKLAHVIMRRPVAILVVTSAVMLTLAIPAFGLHVTSGDNRSTPPGTEAADGLLLLESRIGPGPLAPNQVVIDTGRPGGATTPATVAAELRLLAELRADRRIEPSTVQAPAGLSAALVRRADLIDPQGRVLQIRAAGHTDAGTQTAVDLVRTIRNTYIPRAGFPASDRVYLTGAPAFGLDFVNKAYSAFKWLLLAVLVITYFVLLRAFRSVVLPIKAVLMNILSITATYGALVLVFQHGIGKVVGFHETPQIEAWIPIFLFAMLVRALDGLRDLPAHAHARGVGSPPRQRARRGVRPGAHRTHHHRRRRDHDRRVLGADERQRSSACRSSASVWRSRSSSTRRSCGRCSCRR